MQVLSLDSLISKGEIADKKVLMRVDFNVPINPENGSIESDIRIKSALPSIKNILDANGKLILASHLGRPVEGEYDQKFSLDVVANNLSELLAKPVRLVKEYLDSEELDISSGEIILLENVRRLMLVKNLMMINYLKKWHLCVMYTYMMLLVPHIEHKHQPMVLPNMPKLLRALLMSEIEALSKCLTNPRKPLVAIGGSKVSSKLTVLKELSGKVDQLIVGGGIANTFLAAIGHLEALYLSQT